MNPPHPDQTFEAQPVASGAVGQEPGALVRSEERLNISTQRAVAGRARLEKFLVTETRTMTVEVSREEVRVVLIDADSVHDTGRADHSDAGTAQDFEGADRDRWLILQEERVVVTKEWVPMERARLQVFAVTEDREITEDVRREEIELDQSRPTADVNQADDQATGAARDTLGR